MTAHGPMVTSIVEDVGEQNWRCILRIFEGVRKSRKEHLALSWRGINQIESQFRLLLPIFIFERT